MSDVRKEVFSHILFLLCFQNIVEWEGDICFNFFEHITSASQHDAPTHVLLMFLPEGVHHMNYYLYYSPTNLITTGPLHTPVLPPPHNPSEHTPPEYA